MKAPARVVRLVQVACLVVGALQLGGCNPGTRAVSGLVLPGRASVVTVVDGDDPRLAVSGVGDVRVKLTRGGGAIAESVSGPDGSFLLRVEDRYFYDRVELEASGPGVLVCRGSLYLPGGMRRVLVLVEASGSGGVGEPGR